MVLWWKTWKQACVGKDNSNIQTIYVEFYASALGSIRLKMKKRESILCAVSFVGTSFRSSKQILVIDL
jgi:hypothetical protein